jgi:hypothetical protein
VFRSDNIAVGYITPVYREYPAVRKTMSVVNIAAAVTFRIKKQMVASYSKLAACTAAATVSPAAHNTFLYIMRPQQKEIQTAIYAIAES